MSYRGYEDDRAAWQHWADEQLAWDAFIAMWLEVGSMPYRQRFNAGLRGARFVRPQ